MSSKLTAAQREKASQFAGVTGRSEAAAATALAAHGWNLERACDAFFANPDDFPEVAAPASAVDEKRIVEMFGRYAEAGDADAGTETAVRDAGLERLLADTGVDAADVLSLLMAWKFGGKLLGEFSRAEFVAGCKELRADSPEKLRAALPALRSALNDNAQFREFYMFVFDYARSGGTARVLASDMAVEMWKLVLKGRFAQLDDWCAFIGQLHQAKKKQSFTRDEWSQVLEFATRHARDPVFASYDESSAWPVILDEFVAHVRSKSASTA